MLRQPLPLLIIYLARMTNLAQSQFIQREVGRQESGLRMSQWANLRDDWSS